jgi:hypothetical protein
MSVSRTKRTLGTEGAIGGGYSIVYVTYNPVNYHWHLIIRSFRTLLTTYN